MQWCRVGDQYVEKKGDSEFVIVNGLYLGYSDRNGWFEKLKVSGGKVNNRRTIRAIQELLMPNDHKAIGWNPRKSYPKESMSKSREQKGLKTESWNTWPCPVQVFFFFFWTGRRFFIPTFISWGYLGFRYSPKSALINIFVFYSLTKTIQKLKWLNSISLFLVVAERNKRSSSRTA